ncbi:Epimerase domain-containing protein [Trichoderma simmonsii]|uniref:Epimerase domain-containing protein n=1 Tax=Trichoderma simmonsii TaxID=1491479 RepID=A0A8G0L3L3_9HYPO|nr:Epimerase domain-containing protein [Trichoderma simmonsii]
MAQRKMYSTSITDKDDNYTWEKNNADAWPSRKVDVTIIEAGERLGVKTIIINPPLIYGQGNGIGNQRSIQIPVLVEISLKKQQAIVLGKGEGLWTVAHISDVAAFYSLVLKRYLEGQSIDSGKNGYYFLENGEISWLDISKHIAEVGYSQGLFPSEETKEITLEDFSEALAIPHLKDLNMIEVVWGSNARIQAMKSREIEWNPHNGLTEFYKSIEDEFNSFPVEGTQG